MIEHKITFYPGGEIAIAADESNLLRVLAAAGLYIAASCGGNQTCGKCKVIIESGDIYEEETSSTISETEIAKGYRLACACRVKSDLVVRIPVESQMSDKRVLEESVSLGGSTSGKRLLIQEKIKEIAPLAAVVQPYHKLNPILKKYYLELPLPTISDNIDDFSRLKRWLKQLYNIPDCEINLFSLKKLANVLRKSDFKVTITLLEKNNTYKVINIEQGDRTHNHYSISIDIGTTSIYVSLIDLSSGEILATASDYNAQIAYGEDVITRIVYSLKGNGLEILQQVVIKTMNTLITQVLEESGVSREDTSFIIAAGNTVMIHLLLGITPRYLREAPYIPTINLAPEIQASKIGLDFQEYVYLYLIPGVASYVGGDIIAGVIATNIFQSDKITMYIDIGTNGEIVIGNKDWLVSTSCSAGPALEGGAIQHGMRATVGAIEQVEIGQDYEPMFLTIGHKPPKGICGAGLISLVSEMLESGIINRKGKFNTEINTTRIREKNGRKEYVLCYKKDTAISEDIVITEPDIDDLIRAKGAVYAGIWTLLKSVGLDMSDVSKIIISGNLGFHIEIEKAIAIGLFPEIDSSSFSFIGNGSLLGTMLCACSKEMLEQACKVAKSMTNIELADNQVFIDEYISALFLPHTDEKRFPEKVKL